MNEKEMILEAMKKAGEPLNAGKIAELTAVERDFLTSLKQTQKKLESKTKKSDD